jgi:hypothetical protein
MPYRSTRLQMMYDTDPEAFAPLASEVESCPPHHFVIDSPSGSERSHGACKKCGQTREYRNWLDQYEYMGAGWKLAG